MATRANIENAIFDSMVIATGLAETNIVWIQEPTVEGESAPQPDGLYISLDIIAGLSRIGLNDEVIMPPAASPRLVAIVNGQRLFTLSIQAYGEGASDTIQDAINYFQLPSVNGAIKVSQLDTVEVITVLDSTAYFVDVGNTKVTITSGIGATYETIRDALVLAIDALPNITATAEPSLAEFKLETASGYVVPLSLDSKLSLVGGSHREAVDVSYLRDSGEIPLTSLIDGIRWERRAAVDFFLTTKTQVEDDIGLIETVEITDEIFTETTFSIGA